MSGDEEKAPAHSGVEGSSDKDLAASESPIRRRYRQLRARAFALTWLAYALLYLCRKNLSVAKEPLSRDRGLSNADLGDIDTAYLTAYAVGQFGNGALGDRIGGRRLVGLGLMAAALLAVGFGLGHHMFWFVGTWALNGLAQSTGWPGCAKVFSNWFAREERGTFMGLWSTCYQVGPVLATLLATFLLVNYGWRFSFVGPALVLFGYGLLFLGLQPAAPKEVGLPDVETYHARITNGAPVAPGRAEAGGSGAMLEVIRNRTIWTLGLTYVVLKFIRYTFLFWLPLYMSQQLGYSAGEAGYTSVVFDLAGIVGVIFAGLASDRLFASRRAPIVVIMMVLLAAATSIYSQLGAQGRGYNLVGIAVIGFLLYGPDSITAGVAAVDFGRKRAASSAAGFVNGLGSIGGALSGVAIGRLSAAYGWESVFAFFAPLCILGALLMATMWRAQPNASTRSQQ
jgi:sugar phosphate permease